MVYAYLTVLFYFRLQICMTNCEEFVIKDTVLSYSLGTSVGYTMELNNGTIQRLSFCHCQISEAVNML